MFTKIYLSMGEGNFLLTKIHFSYQFWIKNLFLEFLDLPHNSYIYHGRTVFLSSDSISAEINLTKKETSFGEWDFHKLNCNIVLKICER